MKLPKLGLGFSSVKVPSWEEWKELKEELENLLASYGYVSDKSTAMGLPSGEKTKIGNEEIEILTFGRKIVSLAETIGLNILGEPEIGILLSGIQIRYFFGEKQKSVPLRIEIRPGIMGQLFRKEYYSMAVIEKTEPVLTKGGFFKTFYKCIWENTEIKSFGIDCET